MTGDARHPVHSAERDAQVIRRRCAVEPGASLRVTSGDERVFRLLLCARGGAGVSSLVFVRDR